MVSYFGFIRYTQLTLYADLCNMLRWVFTIVLAGISFGQVNAQIHFWVRLAGSENDAEETLDDNSIDLTSSDLEMCKELNIWPIPDEDQVMGVRFNNINIPKNAQIDSAYIRFTVDETNTDPATILIYGEAVSNAQQFYSLPANISSRQKTISSASWYVPGWGNSDNSGADQETPQLKNIVQEITSRPGWVAGNSMVFLFEGTGTRVAHAYDGDAAKAAELHIHFSSGVGVSEEQTFEWDMYPNPANDFVRIVSDLDEPAELVILDLSGKEMVREQFSGQNDIDITSLSSGIYLVQVSTESKTATHKLIKQ